MEVVAADALLGSMLDKYRVERRIGSGGMGRVYRGVHSWTERPVAIKVLHTILAPEAADARRFLREARTATSLRHPNVVDVLDMGRDSAGRVYLVMELLTGRSLGARLKEQRRIELPETLAYLLPIMEALARAHERGIVHRDVKPDNVFLAEGPSGVVPKLLDFGVAKLVDCAASAATDSGALLGTPRYMAPEQINGERTVGAAADIWAMGMVAYECLAGTLPFGATPSLPFLLLKLVSDDAPSLATHRPQLPAAVIAAVDRALRRDPESRFASIGEFAAALAGKAQLAPGAPARSLAPPSVAALAARPDRPWRIGPSRRTLARAAALAIGTGLITWALAVQQGADGRALEAVELRAQTPVEPSTRGEPERPLPTLQVGHNGVRRTGTQEPTMTVASPDLPSDAPVADGAGDAARPAADPAPPLRQALGPSLTPTAARERSAESAAAGPRAAGGVRAAESGPVKAPISPADARPTAADHSSSRRNRRAESARTTADLPDPARRSAPGAAPRSPERPESDDSASPSNESPSPSDEVPVRPSERFEPPRIIAEFE